MKTGAVIVAAGMSVSEDDFKPMMNMGDMSIIGRVIANFQQADVFPIVVVTGYKASALEKHISKMGVVCVRNSHYATTEMFDSAVAGFSFIRHQCERIFFTPADIPLFTYNTVRQLLAVPVGDVVEPVYNGHKGHPILLSGDLVDKIMEYDGPEGMKQAIERYAEQISLVNVDDKGVLLDVDAKEKYDDLVERSNKNLFRPAIDVSLMREGRLFDKEAALLLRLVAYTGTVKDASVKMGISYSKAWKMISALEDNLGFSLLERQPGGDAGGTSVLTQEGRQLLQQYEQYVGAVKKYANIAFKKYFNVESQ
jgi:molybdate transport repressor ModE-like protein